MGTHGTAQETVTSLSEMTTHDKTFTPPSPPKEQVWAQRKPPRPPPLNPGASAGRPGTGHLPAGGAWDADAGGGHTSWRPRARGAGGGASFYSKQTSSCARGKPERTKKEHASARSCRSVHATGAGPGDEGQGQARWDPADGCGQGQPRRPAPAGRWAQGWHCA